MSSRRNFLASLASLIPSASYARLFPTSFQMDNHVSKARGRDPKEVARDEDFWYVVQQCFQPSPHFINLEHGFYCASPTSVMENLAWHNQRINQLSSYYMRKLDENERLEIRKLMAEFAGVDTEELLITRSTTESLDAVIMGLDIHANEEVIVAASDYPNMLAAWQMKAKRYGVVLKSITIPLTPERPEEVVECYKKAITPKTKYLHLSHMINMNGQLLPVAEIAEMAHQSGIEVICDASHSFAHVDYKIPDLKADYFAASLHKWLAAPVGSGLLHIKKEKIKKVWPLFGDWKHPEDDIRKFERIGTYPAAIFMAVASALRFHNSLGTKVKEERLRYLKNYWVSRVRSLRKIKFNTPLDDLQSCAITNFSVEGKTPNEVADYLYDKHRIFTVGYDRGGIRGVRVTPHIYTTLKELDRLVEAIETYIKL